MLLNYGSMFIICNGLWICLSFVMASGYKIYLFSKYVFLCVANTGKLWFKSNYILFSFYYIYVDVFFIFFQSHNMGRFLK